LYLLPLEQPQGLWRGSLCIQTIIGLKNTGVKFASAIDPDTKLRPKKFWAFKIIADKMTGRRGRFKVLRQQKIDEKRPKIESGFLPDSL
jgi:hypothetical protein